MDSNSVKLAMSFKTARSVVMPTDQHQLARPIRAGGQRPVQFLEDARKRIVGLALRCAVCVLAPLLFGTPMALGSGDEEPTTV